MTAQPSHRDDAVLDALFEFAIYDWPIQTIARMAGVTIDGAQLTRLHTRGLIDRCRQETVMAPVDDVAQDAFKLASTVERQFEWILLSDRGTSYVRQQRRRERTPYYALSRDVATAARLRLDAAALVIATAAMTLSLAALILCAWRAR